MGSARGRPLLAAQAAQISANAIIVRGARDAANFKAGDRVCFSPVKITTDMSAARSAGAFRSGVAVVGSIDIQLGVVLCESDVKGTVVAICDDDYVYLLDGDPIPMAGIGSIDRSGVIEAFRRQAALECLLVFLESPGAREDKVRAAVDYATQLTNALAAAPEASR